MSFFYAFSLLVFFASKSSGVEYASDPNGQEVCTCNTVSGNVCMAWTCPYYSVKTGCFPSSSQVLLPDGNKKSLADLQVGEQVMAGDGTYETVLDFIHSKREGQAEYLRISTTNSSEALYISPNHLIFLFDEGDKARFAGQLRVGDHLKRVTSGGEIVSEEITYIQLVTSQGYYAPLTPSGTIVVDGLVASNYAVVSNHRLAHQMMGIYRWWIRIFGPKVKGGNEEQEQVHWLMQTMEKFARCSIVEKLAGNEFYDGSIQVSAFV